MIIRAFEPADTDNVVQLWRDCSLTRPHNNPRLDIERKLTVQPEMFLVGRIDGRIMASIMVGYDGHRGWINYLAVAPAEQGSGHGRRLMLEAERMLTALGCPKINLQIRTGNNSAMSFYRSLGYAADDAVSLGKRVIPD